MLVEEMETQVTPRRKIIDTAQSEIIDIAKRLISDGRVTLMEQDDEELGEAEF
jgi:flagellar motor switch protein FliG